MVSIFVCVFFLVSLYWCCKEKAKNMTRTSSAAGKIVTVQNLWTEPHLILEKMCFQTRTRKTFCLWRHFDLSVLWNLQTQNQTRAYLLCDTQTYLVGSMKAESKRQESSRWFFFVTLRPSVSPVLSPESRGIEWGLRSHFSAGLPSRCRGLAGQRCIMTVIQFLLTAEV